MAFPRDRLPLRHELAFGAEPAGDPSTWTWTDVSTAVLRQEITIRRGRADESSQPSPASATVQLDNPNGDFTPGHPLGAYYPLVRQGVPYRISVQAGGPYLRIPGDGATCAAPSSPTFNTTDLDVRLEFALDRLPGQWGATAPAGETPWDDRDSELIGRYLPAGNQRSWRVVLSPIGSVWVAWTEDGTTGTFREIVSTAVVPYASGQRCAIRVTLDVDNGAAGHTASFWHAQTLEGPWLPLGDPVTVAGTTTIYDSTAPITIGDLVGIALITGAGRYYRTELRDGIGGAIVAGPDFTAAEPGDSSVTDPQGNTWAVSGGASITDWRTRMVGEVAEWAPTWPWGDLSDLDDPEDRPGEARTDITVAGILRRLGQGAKPLQSTLRRRIPSYSPTAYWPLEEERSATQAYSPIDGVRPMTVSGFSFGSDDTLAGSSALPTVSQGAAFRAVVPSAPAGEWRVAMVYLLDAMPTSGSNQILDIRTTGAPWNRFEIRVTATPAVQVIAYDTTSDSSASTLLINSTPPQFTGEWSKLYLDASTSGGTVTITLRWLTIGEGGFSPSATYTGTAGRVTQVLGAGMPEGLRMGHLAAFPVAETAAYVNADTGFNGERAIERLRRLAREESLPLSAPGIAAESALMGPQRPATLLDLMQQVVDADGGILAELRDVPGLHYRPRHLLYNQRPALELSAWANEIDAPFTPTLDDQRLRNDITVTRDGGSSARAVDDQSVAERGLYDDSVTVNVADDGQVEPIAWWHLYRGTWPGMRYPAVTTALDLAPQTIDRWMDRTEGDRIQVTDLPPQHPTDTVDLMVEGTTETLSPTRWSIEANASPGGPWVIGEVARSPSAPDDPPHHIDTDGSQLAAGATSIQTTLSVTTTTGPTWTTTPSDFPFNIRVGGEVMTVTAIAGATSPQTFTVIRSVNGISKSHASGASLRLATPMIVGL